MKHKVWMVIPSLDCFLYYEQTELLDLEMLWAHLALKQSQQLDTSFVIPFSNVSQNDNIEYFIADIEFDQSCYKAMRTFLSFLN